jgi:predicted dehydrogenase
VQFTDTGLQNAMIPPAAAILIRHLLRTPGGHATCNLACPMMTTEPPFRGQSQITHTAFAGSSPPQSQSEESDDGPSESIPLAPPDQQPENLKIVEPVENQVGWAVVGLGTLAVGEIMPAFAECRFAKPVALVSGHPDKAAKVAEAYHIDQDAIYHYGNFDEIANDPRIDVVYIVLPNSMHAEYTIRALQAGKHVLCEKPMAVSVEEGLAMEQAANDAGRKLAIAYRLHYEPMNQLVMQWCREEKFGRVKTFSSSNCQNVSAPNIRLSKDLGGGPLGDLGVYSINAARYCLDEEPVEVTAFAHQPEYDPRFEEVPASVGYILRYPSGAIAVCDCSLNASPSRRYRVHCSEGYIEMNPAFSYTGLELLTGHPVDQQEQVNHYIMDQVNHFAEEMDGFSRAILGKEEVLTPASMGIADLRIIEAIEHALHTRTAVRIES